MSASIAEALTGSILTPYGWVRGKVLIDGKRIERIAGDPVDPTRTPEPPYIIPGFIDLHVHGGDGTDFTGDEKDIRRFLRFHAAHGATAMAPTTATAPVAILDRALMTIEAIRNDRGPGEPTVLGAHLEGPFINPDKLGAQMNATLAGDVDLALKWADMCRLVVATVAPEIPGGLAVVEALTRRGCRVQIGHSLATAEQTAAAFGRGVSGFTHLFNAMSGLDHRKPGVAAYALAHGRYAEIICDLNHVHPTALRAAYRSIPRLYAITDATTFAGRPDGAYDTSQRRVIKKGLRITLEDERTLAGSAITMLDAFRNLVALGLSLAEASELTSTRQAEYLGVNELGRIVPGALASLVVLDAGCNLQSVWVEGENLSGDAARTGSSSRH
jgi:N-acetylglucosamine-6-phosphate deacetylase